MSGIDAKAVLELARQQQQTWIDEAAAQRIAAGAAAAVEAVRAALLDAPPGLLTDDAAGFLAMLERLAEGDA